MTVIECKNITKHFRTGWTTKIRALDDVSLDVNSGEIFGILGPNGAGKTTLVKTILHLVMPDSGTVEMFGKNVKDHRSRAKVGYLPENPSLPEYLTGGQIIELFGRLSGMSAADITVRMEDMLSEVKMSKWKEKKISTYSKGMIQRLGLAQALISDPDIVFLDEPTDGVDPIGRREIRDVLKGLKDRGKTVFLNSHLLSETEMLCDRVGVMDKGKLVSLGGVGELTATANKYRIKCSDMTEETVSLIRESWPKVSGNNGYIDVFAKDVSALNSIIDIIRNRGVLIESVMPEKQSLETYFVDLIKDIREEDTSK